MFIKIIQIAANLVILMILDDGDMEYLDYWIKQVFQTFALQPDVLTVITVV